MHWNTEEAAGDSLLPCTRELDASDLGQNVDSHTRNTNLIHNLLFTECL